MKNLKDINSVYIRFRTYFKDSNSNRVVPYDYYGKCYRSGELRVYSPDYKVSEQGRANFFRTKAHLFETNKGNSIALRTNLMQAFVDKAIELDFKGYESWRFSAPAVRQHFNPHVECAIKPEDEWLDLIRIKFCKDCIICFFQDDDEEAKVCEYYIYPNIEVVDHNPTAKTNVWDN